MSEARTDEVFDWMKIDGFVEQLYGIGDDPGFVFIYGIREENQPILARYSRWLGSGILSMTIVRG